MGIRHPKVLQRAKEYQAILVLLAALRPPKRLTVSEWADNERVLSPESSAEPGRFYTERAEYQRGIMDAFSDPAIERVVVMSSAQIGKTTIIENCIGYYVSHDPSPILVVQPTLELAKTFSKDRLAPMLRDTPCLQGKVKNARSRDSGNTVLHKTFTGGHITLAGANSPASLAQRPIRVVLCDEVDRFPASAGPEGDPVDLAFKRATTFWNRKLCAISTPTIKGLSRIEKLYEESDQRKYYVPCPHCGEFQVLRFKNLQWPEGRPREAVYICEKCGGEINDRDKLCMIRKGKWIREKDVPDVAGFWINELYSPWVPFGVLASKFVEAKRRGPEALKVFVNTALAEVWEEEGEQIDETGLLSRREDYGDCDVPYGVCYITAGVDVQKDYVKYEVVGWGEGLESWGIEYGMIVGDTAKREVYDALSAFLQKKYRHEAGIEIGISRVSIDTGYRTQHVYDFIKREERAGRRHIYAVKGSSREDDPIVKIPRRRNKSGVFLITAGVNQAKDTIHAYLKVEDPGPCYMHYPLAYPEEYFKELTVEKVVTKYTRGVPKRIWMKPDGARNEAMDCRVYALVALYIQMPDFGKHMKAIEARAEQERKRQEKDESQTKETKRVQPKKLFRPGFVKGWLKW